MSGSAGVTTGVLGGGWGGGGGLLWRVWWMLPLGLRSVIRCVRLTVSVWQVAVFGCFVLVAVFSPLPG